MSTADKQSGISSLAWTVSGIAKLGGKCYTDTIKFSNPPTLVLKLHACQSHRLDATRMSIT